MKKSNLLFILALFVGFPVMFGMKRNSPQNDTETQPYKVQKRQLKRQLDELYETFMSLAASLEELSDDSDTENSDANVDNPKRNLVPDEAIEFTILKKLEIAGIFLELYHKMCKPHVTDGLLIALAHELKETYENFLKENKNYIDFIKAETDFYCCCSLIAFHLSEEKVGKDFAIWFKKISPEGMTKENGLKLMETALNGKLYSFLESI
ncbi:MAG: hypothetical protein ACSW8C_02560 [bacterium]